MSFGFFMICPQVEEDNLLNKRKKKTWGQSFGAIGPLHAVHGGPIFRAQIFSKWDGQPANFKESIGILSLIGRALVIWWNVHKMSKERCSTTLPPVVQDWDRTLPQKTSYQGRPRHLQHWYCSCPWNDLCQEYISVPFEQIMEKNENSWLFIVEFHH